MLTLSAATLAPADATSDGAAKPDAVPPAAASVTPGAFEFLLTDDPEGPRAGYDDGFFLASGDGRFRLDIAGQIQFRYLANRRDDPDDGESTTTGFQHRRGKIGFTGRLANPDIRFRFRPVTTRNGGDLSVDDLWIAYGLTDALTVTAGSFKLPFTRESLNSSTRLQTVERSYVNAMLGFGRSTGVQLDYDGGGPVRLAAMFSDGASSHFEGFHNTTTDYALTARADVRLAGEQGYARDFSGYSDYGFGSVAGAAVHYEGGNTDDDTRNFFTWTVDGSSYMQNVGLYGAVIGRHDTSVVSGAEEYDDFGWLVQGGYMINDTVEPFVRYEQLIPDNSRMDSHTVELVTAGVNWYIRGHDLKWSTDVVWALDPLSGFAGGSDGLGLLVDSPGASDQVVFRTQVQLLF
ncbi:MAG: porin [Phycisphaeraceae bacterium]